MLRRASEQLLFKANRSPTCEWLESRKRATEAVRGRVPSDGALVAGSKQAQSSESDSLLYTSAPGILATEESEFNLEDEFIERVERYALPRKGWL